MYGLPYLENLLSIILVKALSGPFHASRKFATPPSSDLFCFSLTMSAAYFIGSISEESAEKSCFLTKASCFSKEIAFAKADRLLRILNKSSS